MYIYNVTTNIEESIRVQWLSWMREVHIPEMLETGKFTKALMSQVLVEEQMGGITYSIQYTTDSKETLQKYYAEDAERLRKKVMERFAGKFVAFRTELEIISEH
jgi:ABC-type ATPase with predicted acetyltransferase domain